ncbi:hypothetical protein GCM10027612_67950 [Microbispora bryophytorum subsp. camponoti]
MSWKDDSVWTGEDERFVPVLVPHQERRASLWTADLDDHPVLFVVAHDGTVHHQPVPYRCVHLDPPLSRAWYGYRHLERGETLLCSEEGTTHTKTLHGLHTAPSPARAAP